MLLYCVIIVIEVIRGMRRCPQKKIRTEQDGLKDLIESYEQDLIVDALKITFGNRVARRQTSQDDEADNQL